jgi:hypothetical protein
MSERTIVRSVWVFLIGFASLLVLPILYFVVVEVWAYANRDTEAAEQIARERFKGCSRDFGVTKITFSGPVLLPEDRKSYYTFVWTADALGPDASMTVYVGYLPFSVDCFITDKLEQAAEPRAQNPFTRR